MLYLFVSFSHESLDALIFGVEIIHRDEALLPSATVRAPGVGIPVGLIMLPLVDMPVDAIVSLFALTIYITLRRR